MNKLTILTALTLAAAFPAAASCADLDLAQAYSLAGGLEKGSAAALIPVPMPVAAAPVAAPAAIPAAPRAGAKKWTIMLYVDGKNSLEQFVYTNLHQMEQVGSNADVNVVVEVGRMNGQGGDYTGDGNWTGCRRYLIVKSAPNPGIASPILQTIPACDMGDYKHAIDFGKWAMDKFPAEHYMYVIWNHGGGWTETIPGFSSPKAISLDEETKHLINTPQMGSIVKALGHIDVYGSDACLMQMAEVAYEMKAQTDFIVGSEKTEPGSGWDYAAFLKKVYASGMTAQEVANAVVDTYTPQYTTGATMSTIKSSALDGFADKLNTFTDAVMASKDSKGAAAAREGAQNFSAQGSYSENKDLYNFVSLIYTSSKSQPVKVAALDLMNYIKGQLVVDNKVSSDYAKAHGVAIYAPTSGFDSDYSHMLFAGTKWAAFAKWMQK